MKFNPRLKNDVKKYKDYLIIVEGKKDVRALNNLGFEKVYAVHNTGVSLRGSVEDISKQVGKRDRVCILTDFDKKGKQLYMLLKKEFGEMGVRLDNSFRGLLIKARISHIEGLDKFLHQAEK